MKSMILKYYTWLTKLGMGITKIGIVFLSISVLVSFGLASNQAFAGELTILCFFGQDPITGKCFCGPPNNFNGDTTAIIDDCVVKPTVGGDLIPLDSIMILVAGTQTTAAWMIPVIVSAIGIGIVIARKF